MGIRQQKQISIYEEDRTLMATLSAEMGLTDSELIRYAVRKVAADPINRQIILQDFIKEEGNKIGKARLLRIMSIKQSLKKDASTQRKASMAVSLNNRDYDSTEEVSDEEVDAAFASLDSEEESLDDMLKKLFGDKYEKMDQSRRHNR